MLNEPLKQMIVIRLRQISRCDQPIHQNPLTTTNQCVDEHPVHQRMTDLLQQKVHSFRDIGKAVDQRSIKVKDNWRHQALSREMTTVTSGFLPISS